jgi:maltooligosyltrehalose trehalohydrolase
MLEPRDRGGWGLDGVWAGDFHHIVRRWLAGDAHGYYEDFQGSLDELTRTIRQGWLFTGQPSRRRQEPRGTDASALPMQRFVVCLQNHDQIGNRATGDRLHHAIDHAAWRAATTLLLTAPMTPLLFMGQEWAASTPFQYFTDLEPGLGRLVTEGRRLEFREFPEFADPERRGDIPDPQAPSTFEASRLDWLERGTGAHAATLALYAELLRLRRAHPALGADEDVAGHAAPLDSGTLVMRREHGGQAFLVVVRLSGAGRVEIAHGGAGTPRQILSTEEGRFAADPAPARVLAGGGRIEIRFARPGAVVFEIA